jgi:hypothetical protein
MTVQYFVGADFGTPVASTDAEVVRYDWSGGSPDPAVPKDGFSARWNGMLRPRFSETYSFTVRTTDRVRVTVGGLLIVDGWEGDRASDKTTTIELEAGREYPIVVEYRHDSGEASLEVLWESATQPALHVPRSHGFPRRRSLRQ